MVLIMKNLLTTLKTVLFIFFISINHMCFADGNEDGIFKNWLDNRRSGVTSVKFEQYNQLCGSCHFAYQPGLLPGISWEKIMHNLDSHFGQPVFMSPVELRTITRYLLDNSAGHVNDEISNKILQSLKYDPIPIRITKTPYIINRHKDIDSTHNLSQCDNCHQDAHQGSYNKAGIQVPNQSLWNYDRSEIMM